MLGIEIISKIMYFFSHFYPNTTFLLAFILDKNWKHLVVKIILASVSPHARPNQIPFGPNPALKARRYPVNNPPPQKQMKPINAGIAVSFMPRNIDAAIA
tara:strand:- start:82 stop:381 length:300 start_codon:yes stop_codon:yes gene_type:complete